MGNPGKIVNLRRKNSYLKAFWWLFFILVILNIPPVLAGDWFAFDNYKDFQKGDLRYGKATIYDTNIFSEDTKLQEITLLENTEYCLVNCYAEGTTTLYEDSELINDLRFEKSNQGLWKSSNIQNYHIYIQEGTKQKLITKEETICDKNDNCWNEIVDTYYINEPIWKRYNGEILKTGTYNWRLEGQKDMQETIEWIPTFFGEEIDEWATWSSSLNTNLLAYWDFNNNVNDSVAGTYNGTIIAGNYSTGLINNALKLEGNQLGVNITHEGKKILNQSANFSISLWINFANFSAPTYVRIFDKRLTVGSFDEIAILKQANTNEARAILQIASTEQTIIGDNAFGNGTWEHIVFIYNGTTLVLYHNGTIQTSTALLSGKFNSTRELRIGSDGTDEYVNGSIDEVAIWDRVLTASEISDLWNNGAGLTYGGISGGNVTLNNPADAISQTNSEVIFNCSTEDLDAVLNTTLYINGVLNTTITNSSASTKHLSLQRTFNFKEGYYNWTCQGSDNESNLATTNTRTFTINSTIINSETYNTSTYETSTEYFAINISGNGSVTTANLVYNGTSYTGTKTGDNYNMTFYKSLNIPASAKGTATSFYWEINSGGVLKNRSYTQAVKDINLSICDNAADTPYLNLTFKNEANSSNIDATIDASTFYYYIGNVANVNNSFIYSNSTGHNSYGFCFEPRDKTATINTFVQFSKTGYPQRSWRNTTEYTNVTTNETLYLLASADGIYVTFQVITQAEQPIENVYAVGRRDIGGVSTIIGSGYTGADGGVTFWVNPDYSHTFSFSKSGYDTVTETLTPTQSTYTVTMGGAEAETNVSNYNQGITYSWKPSASSLNNNTLYSFNFTISSTYWDLSEYGFVLTNGSDTLGSVSGSTGTGGTVNINKNTGTNRTFVMNYYWVVEGNYSNATTIWIITDTTDYGFSIKTFFDHLKNYTEEGMLGLNKWSLTLIIFIVIFGVVGFVSYNFNLSAGTALFFVGFLVIFFDIGVGLLPTPVEAIEHLYSILTIFVFIGYVVKEVLQRT
jgi:hypothetical protein